MKPSISMSLIIAATLCGSVGANASDRAVRHHHWVGSRRHMAFNNATALYPRRAHHHHTCSASACPASDDFEGNLGFSWETAHW